MEEWRTWTNEELERQMSPSRWNPGKSPDDVINQYLALSNEETQKARRQIPHELNIAYGLTPSQKYDLYGTDLLGKAPIFFWIHGGYWQEGSKDISATMALNLYSVGVKTVVLGYTLAPTATIFQIQKEFLMALQHILGKFPEANYIVGGHSAGAQLAATLLHMEGGSSEEEKRNLTKRLIGLVLISGVYDLRPLVPTNYNDPLKLTNSDAESLSPLLQNFSSMGVKDAISLLICIGEYDPPEFKRQTTDYTRKLKKKFPNARHWLSEKDDHFTIIERLADLSKVSPGRVLIDYVKSVI